MITNLITIFAMVLLALFQVASPMDISKCRILDMSHPLAAKSPYWPGYSAPNFTITHKGPLGKDAPYVSWGFMASFEHISTHIDAPSHFDENGLSVDQVEMEDLVGEARVVDVSVKAKEDPGYGMTVEDIKNHEREHGILQSNSILLMHSGWDAKVDNLADYVGTKDVKDFAKYQYPSFAPEVGKWLVQNRKIRAVGVDSLGFELGGSTSFPNHYALLTNGIPGMENMKNIGKLPPKGAVIFLPPTKIKGGTGAWTRAFAVGWNGQDDPCRIGNNRAASQLRTPLLAYLGAGLTCLLAI